MATGTIVVPKIWKGNTLMGTITSKSMQLDSNISIEQTDAGPVLKKGPSTGTTQVELINKRSDKTALNLIKDMQKAVATTVQLLWSDLGGSALKADYVVASISLTSSSADGSYTASASLTMVKGTVEII